MTGKFRNTYRISSARAPWWDYSNEGVYFLTLCAYRHEMLFGDIRTENGDQTRLLESPIGTIVLQEWQRSFKTRTELFCDAFVLMPNHLHAILRIANPDPPTVKSGNPAHTPTSAAYRPPKSISSFVAGFKSSATKKINALRNTPGAPVWQTRFHDHIIRNTAEHYRITTYIENNPANWPKDRYYMQ